MPRQQNNNRRISKTVVKYDPENAYAWAVIMAKITALRTQGKTMQQIGDLFGVGRDTVSRWISKEFGGEKTTFGDMLRYAKALNIPFEELLNENNKQSSISKYNHRVGRILHEFAEDSDMHSTDIATSSNVPAAEIDAIFSGQSAATPEQLYGICTAIEVNASIVLKRAAKETYSTQ
ncbi:helix-turn-helix domain-containing protein [Halodesulfovibrio marinisediminis]|uniref:Homeodomain-like domain-containing protein n=1 Tax=Halodesulfovibrio marinisediminis DSM 17456 TaxID=1121457 RepID=A0A1N6I2F4_9BACT|nr:helix-turn-helix transcriptional regulator [Halodesulfovibrio marinisediminis]SIO26193.1 Homeodomain-like domain-containing protein [Halodesulfovibrio marinisediminis DSM 17456]